MPLAVRSTKEVADRVCDECGELRKSLIEVDTYSDGVVTVCNEWHVKKPNRTKATNCFLKRFQFGVVECGSSDGR